MFTLNHKGSSGEPDGVTPLWMVLALGLCMGIVMAMLGSPFSFWSLDNTEDLFTDSVLEGFSIPPSPLAIGNAVGIMRLSFHRLCFTPRIGSQTFFHPPNPTR